MVVFMVLYVDDIMFIGNDVELLSLMKNLGETQDILRIKFLRDCKNRKSLLSQATYIDKLLIKYVMHDSKKGLLSLWYEIPYSRDHLICILNRSTMISHRIETKCPLGDPKEVCS
ncbi:hypothetical protein AAG906_040643 [Vitis piasezkii]